MSVGTVIERRRRNLGSSVQQFPKNLGAHAILFTFKKYEYEKPGTRSLNKVSATTLSTANLAASDNIMLPLPSELSDNFSVSLNSAGQGIEGEAISSTTKALSNIQDISMDSFKNAMNSAFPELKGISNNLGKKDVLEAGAFLGRRTLAKYAPGYEQSVDAGLGSMINPKQALFFSGIELRNHTFNWSFAPTNSAESDILRNIGNTIKRNVLPSYGNVGPISRLLLNYPSVVDIYFFGIDQSYFLYYKTCMVNTFNINFAPNGLAFVQGGKPAAVTMEMAVTEMDIHTSEDYGGDSSFEGLTVDQQTILDAQKGLRGF